MRLVLFGPGMPDSPSPAERLADALAEAAASADYAGEPDLAQTLHDRVAVLRWADSRTIREG